MIQRDTHGRRLLKWAVALAFFAHIQPGHASSEVTNPIISRLEKVMLAAQKEYAAQPRSEAVAWAYARACFDRAEFPSNSSHRAELANAGIAAAQAAITQNSNSAPAHYYLALDMGQLARTKSLGALRLVDEMEVEFKRAIKLDENFDFAGPDRNLGRLYFQAPSFASIGSQSKARQHFERAAKLAPDYPENRLNLIEGAIRWKETKAANRELDTYEKNLEKARGDFTGEAWDAAWLDWNARYAKACSALHRPTRDAAGNDGGPKTAP